MNVELLPFRSEADVAAAMPRVLDQLANDRLIVYPTETVYGFGGAITATAAAALARLKQRGALKPFLLLIEDPSQAPGVQWTDAARTVAELFWPGPLTLVLRAESADLPQGVVAPDGTVALRATSHTGVRSVVHAWRGPITSSSANAPRQPPARSAEEAVAALGALAAGTDAVLVLDGGVLPESRPSTIVACEGMTVRVLRDGALTVDELRTRLEGTGIDVR